MIPIKDENPTQIIPYVTFGLIFINLAVYIYQLTLDPRQEMYFVYHYGAVPALLTGQAQVNLQDTMIPWPLTLITSAFLHGGLFHLAGNMLYLWIFGNNIEDALGHVKFIVFYLVGGVLAGLAHVATNPASPLPMIGASGAIAAVLGAYLVLYPRANVVIMVFLFFIVQLVKVPAVVVLMVWFFLQIVGGGEGVAWMAHVGGFVAGMLLIHLFNPRPVVLR